MYKKLKTEDFFNMLLFIFEIESFNFCICQKTTFAWSGLEQVSSWWINSQFCVYKVSIWRCLLMLTFSGLHFLFYFQQGANPQWTRICQNASLCSGQQIDEPVVDEIILFISNQYPRKQVHLIILREAVFSLLENLEERARDFPNCRLILSRLGDISFLK